MEYGECERKMPELRIKLISLRSPYTVVLINIYPNACVKHVHLHDTTQISQLALHTIQRNILPTQDLCKWCCQQIHPFIRVTAVPFRCCCCFCIQFSFKFWIYRAHIQPTKKKKIRIVKDGMSFLFLRTMHTRLFSTRKCTPIASFIWSGFNVCQMKIMTE